MFFPTAGLSCRHTEALWHKLMPCAEKEAGEGARVTFTGFLESVRAYEACLGRGEVLGFSKIECNPNFPGGVVDDGEQ